MKISRKFVRESNLYTEVSSYLYNIFASPQNILRDEVILDDFQVRHLKEVLERYPGLERLFIKEGLIEEEDKNPFKKDLSYEDINNLNNTLYRVLGGEFIYVANNACSNIITGGRRDLQKRSLYVIPEYEVLLHTTTFGGKVIEIKKK